ncbi:hypothetical protein [Actinomadura violacea]|uniref:Uncharacterized protein n=1 Tax=Actinomadura violacea TaxID=2819934 RepID=A0ABS3S919_9ACTN|nr:hypothetical protein [Actinomadura violacea]MBO2465366.1 hypothetical protein [Actinomadura violacea]
MPLTDADIAATLAPAGLLFIEREEDEVRLPLKPGRSAASSRREDGRFDARPEEVVDVNDPELAAKLNAGWLRMAVEFGLFNEQREFLISVDYSEDPVYEPEQAWAQVRLLEKWDFAGSGVEQFRGHFAGMFTTRFVPEFWALSLDQRVLTNTTIWGNGTVSTIVIRPA